MVAPPLAAGGGPPGGALSPAAAWMEAYADSTVLVVRLAGAVDMAPDVDVEAAINHHHRALVTMTDFLKLNTDGSLIWKFRGFSTRYLFFCCPVVNAEEHADVMAGAVLRLRALLSRQKSLGGAAVAATFGLCSGPTAAALIGTSVLEMVIEGNPVHVAKQLARQARGIAVRRGCRADGRGLCEGTSARRARGGRPPPLGCSCSCRPPPAPSRPRQVLRLPPTARRHCSELTGKRPSPLRPRPPPRRRWRPAPGSSYRRPARPS